MYQKNVNIKIICKKSKEGEESLRLSKSQYIPSKLWVDLSVDYECKSLYPIVSSVRAIAFTFAKRSMC